MQVLIAVTELSSVTLHGNIALNMITILKWIPVTCTVFIIVTKLACFPHSLALLCGANFTQTHDITATGGIIR